jgi:hypothetical protein
MDPKENERAERLAIRFNNYRSIMSEMYDNIVDREFDKVDTDARFLIMELRFILKSMEEDDF